MNKDRRKAIDAVLKDLEALKVAIAALPATDDIQSAIQTIAEEEREYYDNMNENLQGGEKGETAEQAASNLEEAASEAEELGLSDLEEKIDEIVSKLEAARDGG